MSDRRRSYGGRSNYYPRDTRDGRDRDSFPGRDRDSFSDRSKRKFDDSDDTSSEIKIRIVKIGDCDGLQGGSEFVVGESETVLRVSRKVEGEIDRLALGLLGDVRDYGDQIIGDVVDCATYIPSKSAIYATLTALLNATNPNFGSRIFSKSYDRFLAAIQNWDYTKIKLLLRYFCELANAWTISSREILDILKVIVSEVTVVGSPQSRKDYFASLFFSVIPNVGALLLRESRAELSDIFSALDEYMRSRTFETDLEAINPYTKGITLIDCLEEWYRAIKVSYTKDFRGLDVTLISICDTFKERIQTGRAFELRPVQFRAHTSATSYPRTTRFPIFSREELQGEFDEMHLWWNTQTIHDTLTAFSDDPIVCAKQLLALPARSEVLIVQVIFDRMFELPHSSFPTVFYGAVVLELCRLSRAVQPFIGKSIDFVFKHCEELDLEVLDRFVSFFSFHLSNTDFKWPWNVWASVLEADPQSRAHIMVREMIEACVRLSFHDRVKKSLRESFFPLLPPTPIHQFDFDSKHTHAKSVELAEQLIGMFKDKRSPEEIIGHVQLCVLFPESRDKPKESEDVMEDDEEEDDEDSNRWKSRRVRAKDVTENEKEDEAKREIVWQVMLHVGSKSYSHIVNLIERNIELFQHFFSTMATRQLLLKTLCHVWQSSHQLIEMICQKLISCRVVDPTSIVDWVFADENASKLTESWLWAILFDSMDRMVLRSSVIRQELDTATEENRKDDDPVTADKILELQREHDESLKEVKDTFLVIFQRFRMALSDRLTMCNPDTDFWFRTVLLRLLQTGRQFTAHVAPFVTFLEEFLFSAEVDQRITRTFHTFKRLCGEPNAQ